MKRNVILADCTEDELLSFKNGIEATCGISFDIDCKPCNYSHTTINNIKRYFHYATYPFRYALHSGDYGAIIGWQQFFALFFAFYCRLLHKKKTTKLVVANFTYKEKSGVLGRLYKRLMTFCLCNDYVDYIHVPSDQYARVSSKQLGVPIEKFIVTSFGIDDNYSYWRERKSKLKDREYTLAIGRSNRDYDFLLDAWSLMPENRTLILISDTYVPKRELPSNVIHRTDISGWKQFPFIVNCTNMVIPIQDGSICSGDTVLLKAMSFERPVVVTYPSTLAEMYIENGKDGLCVEKDAAAFASAVEGLYTDEEFAKAMGATARTKFLSKFSRYSMGCAIASQIR